MSGPDENASRKATPGHPPSPPSAPQALTVQQAIDLAVQHHTRGRLAEAESIYLQILQADPNQPAAMNLLGVIAHQVGNNDRAFDLITKAIALDPDYADAHSNLGNALLALGRLDDAVVSFRKALDLNPDYAEVLNNLGNALRDLGRLDEAVASFHKALRQKPDFALAHYNLGLTLRNLGELDDAVASYRKSLDLNPDIAEAHNNLGNVLQELGKADDAEACYLKALALKPDYAGAHGNLGLVMISDGRRAEALGHFNISLELERGADPIDPGHYSFRLINKTKINHDIEQFSYLAAQGHEAERFQSLARVYEAVDREIDWPHDLSTTVPLSGDHLRRLGDTYNRPIHVLEAPEIAGSTLSGGLDVEKITSDYFAPACEMTYFDNLLSADALASLRRFLLGSTIWFNFRNGGGYLGAMLKDGLSCSLLLQIADDLRLTFPEIFKNHQLAQLWAYKYDSQLAGIRVHADSAAVNVNFWITPDAANLDPASGGLVVYDIEAPLDWNFKIFNTDQNRIRAFLAEQGSGKSVVPYGENRIVMFNSNLFHETDTIDFKQGYENRRINVTMLFGNR